MRFVELVRILKEVWIVFETEDSAEFARGYLYVAVLCRGRGFVTMDVRCLDICTAAGAMKVVVKDEQKTSAVLAIIMTTIGLHTRELSPLNSV